MAHDHHGLSFDEARAAMRARAVVPAAEPVALDALAGRVLAEDVRARIDHPAFANSAMDGFAVRAADVAGGAPVRLVGESRAGVPFAGAIGPGEAVRISTGAEVPEGADAILRKEDADDRGDAVAATAPPPAGTSVRRRGEDVRQGQVLLPAGHRVAPHEVGVVAAAGHAAVSCRRRPRVVVVGSGDELVQPGGDPGPGQVFDSNRHGVAAQARAAGAEVLRLLLVPDDRAATEAALAEALDGDRPDVLVTIGGVSVGRHDHLRPALEACGVAQVFFGVAIRPGHPLWLGERGGQRVLGLPGNPVSSAVCFHAFGRELLGAPDDWDARMPLGEAYVKDTPRTEIVRCREADGALRPLPRQGSHAITSLASATHLAVIPAERREVPPGTLLRTSRLG
ncbi:MAG TPA: gephyrin-like molybdotransferase Glp [Miltoncostaeaceae bacterium]|nr:gephyrin-like molybdotransferase Glp [Miltoncostaeaceae bacterium]